MWNCYSYIAGVAPYVPSYHRATSGMPVYYKNKQLPACLAIVGSKNRAIYLKVINYEAEERSSAVEWYSALKAYTIQDDS